MPDLTDVEIWERLKKGADVNAPVEGCNGKTFLMMAQTAELTKELIARGADVFSKDQDGWTAWEWARHNRRWAVAKVLEVAVMNANKKAKSTSPTLLLPDEFEPTALELDESAEFEEDGGETPPVAVSEEEQADEAQKDAESDMSAMDNDGGKTMTNEEIQKLYEEIQKLHFDDAVIQQSFEGWKEKIAKINRFNSVDKYKVVFIGRPGSGKTTAICNWLNLLHIEIGQDPRKAELLSTGSGNTTVAEVHIRQITEGNSCIRLEYLSDEAQRQYINEYASYLYNGFNDDDMNEDNDTVPLVPIEIQKMIQNMAGFDTIPSTTEPEKWKHFYNSEVGEFETLEDFQAHILRKINLESRSTKEISFTEGDDFKSWLQKNFEAINYGKNKNCSIPKCIYIDIRTSDLNMQLPEFVSEIVDTLGLDTEPSARMDLQKFMNEEDSICILVDEINNPPADNLRNVIKNSFRAGAEYLKEKVALYIRLKEDELENVHGADGDPDEGKKIRLNEIQARVHGFCLPYLTENTIFINSREAYVIGRIFRTGTDGKRRSENRLHAYDVQLAQENRNRINEWLRDRISTLKSVLSRDAVLVSDNTEKLKAAQNLNDKQRLKTALQNIKRIIVDTRDDWQVPFTDTSVCDKMADQLGDRHHQTIKAMNRRFGGYDTYKIDVYTEFMQAGKNDFTEKANILKNNLTGLFISEDNEAQTAISGYVQRIDNMISEFIDNFGNSLLEWLLNSSSMYPQSDENTFWIEMQAIHGTRFKTRALQKYKDDALRIGEDKIVELFKKEYNTMLDRVISWLPNE